MKKHISLILLILFIISSGTIDGQEIKKRNSIENYPKYTIAIQPWHLINGTLKIDFETQLNSPKNWLQVTVSGSYLKKKDLYPSGSLWSTFNSDFDDFHGLSGFGTGVAYKSIFYPTWFYYSIGVNYAYYNVHYPSYGFHPYVEDGLTYYDYYRRLEKQTFNKLSSSLCIGMQSNLNSDVFFDIYIGIGYAYSIYDKNKRAFDENIYGFGRRGTFFAGGVRFGFAFGR